MNNRKFRIGLIQSDVLLGDSESNLASALKEIGILADKGADIVLLPEMWSCGFDNPNLSHHAEKTSKIIEILSRAAEKYKLLIAGSVPEASENQIFNTMYLIERDGSVAGTYRKAHLFPLTREPDFFAAGNRNVVCQTSLGAIGLMICYDLRFPELARALALKRANLVLVSAQWPLIRISHWNMLLQARSVENQIFVAGVNRCGQDPGLEYGGHSQLISPWGNIIVKAGTEACSLIGEVDIREIEEFRSKIPCLEQRVPEAYEC
jgi:omega-amidase